MKYYYNAAVENKLKRRNVEPVTLYQLFKCFTDVYDQLVSKLNCISTYRATGIVLLNKNIFPDYIQQKQITNQDQTTINVNNTTADSNSPSKNITVSVVNINNSMNFSAVNNMEVEPDARLNITSDIPPTVTLLEPYLILITT